jgi:hypothetical protein
MTDTRDLDLEDFAQRIDTLVAKVKRLQAKLTLLHALNGPSKMRGFWCACGVADHLGGAPSSANHADTAGWKNRAVVEHRAHVHEQIELAS